MRQPSHFDRRARRQADAEIIMPDIDMFEEFIDVGHEGRGLDQVVKGGAGRLQRVLEVFTDLPDLRTHVAGADDVAVLVAGQLAGDEHQLFTGGDDDVRIKHVTADVSLEQ